MLFRRSHVVVEFSEGDEKASEFFFIYACQHLVENRDAFLFRFGFKQVRLFCEDEGVRSAVMHILLADHEPFLFDCVNKLCNGIRIDDLIGNSLSREEMIEEGYRMANKEIGYRIEHLK